MPSFSETNTSIYPLIVLYRGRQQTKRGPCRTKAAITAHNVVRLLSLEVTEAAAEAAAARLSTHSEFVMKYFSKKKAHGFLL